MSNKALNQQAAPRESINQACMWLARLWADDATEEDRVACLNWRQSAWQNEQAWQQVQQLQQKFRDVPDPQTGSQLLRQKRVVSRRQFIAYAGIGAGVMLTGQFSANQFFFADYATRSGEIQEIRLVDGTRLFVNTSTRVDIHFDQSKREIVLREGEIYIETARHPSPLVVISRDGILQPLGTHFSVRRMNDHTRLAVYEGRVQIQSEQSSKTAIIESGYGADFTPFGVQKNYAVKEENIAWTTHKLVATNMPLTEFATELSRYRRGVLRVSPELTHLTITGVFSLRDTERVLEQLTEILPIRLQSFTSIWVTVLPA